MDFIIFYHIYIRTHTNIYILIFLFAKEYCMILLFYIIYIYFFSLLYNFLHLKNEIKYILMLIWCFV